MTYPPPTWFQQHVGMWFVQTGWAIRYGTLWADWGRWWKAAWSAVLIGCIPLKTKDRLRRRIRGW